MIPLTSASSDFPVCPAVVEAIVSYVKVGYFPYGPPEGLPSFRQAYAAYYTAQLRKVAPSAVCDPTRVCAANAAAAAVFQAVATVLKPGDEALVMAPVDFLMAAAVEAAGGVVKRYGAREIPTLATRRTKLLAICNPHNPLGVAWTKAHLQALCGFAEKHGLWILSDEVWGALVFEPSIFVPTAAVSEYAESHTITISGFSKSHGLEGLRVGALVAPSEDMLQQSLLAVHADTTADGCSTLAQVAAIAAMEHADAWLGQWRTHLSAMLDLAVARLKAMAPLVNDVIKKPQACFVVFVDVTPVASSDVADLAAF